MISSMAELFLDVDIHDYYVNDIPSSDCDQGFGMVI